ncbi:hypothetical protein [Janthinobacterium sp. MDT1-19]|uniref:hypothetical protein n=1 Tax=Janthinobacterium sp. MDT1-19 TaxID=1259339 RepID=UPI003F1EA97F
MLDLSIALILMSIMAAANLNAKAFAQRLSFASMQGDALAELAAAGDTYLQENFTALQSGIEVIHGAASLNPGSDQGQTYAPLVKDLLDMNYLTKGFNAGSLYSRGQIPGNYIFKISRVPEGCQVPDSTKCGLVGYVYIDQPIQGGEKLDVDGPALNTMLAKLGNKGCMSILSNPAVMIGGGGDCGIPNPVSGNPPGIVLARFGFGSSGLTNFVRLNDTRDPKLLGPLTVAKTSTAREFATDSKVLGSTCEVENSIGSGIAGAAICIGKKWQSMGEWAGLGENCNQEGKLASNIGTGEQLICKDGKYKKLLSFMARTILMKRVPVRDGDIVNKIACDSGGTADRSFSIVQTSVNLTTAPPMASMDVSTADLGYAWAVSIKLKDDENNIESGNNHDLTQVLNLECSY